MSTRILMLVAVVVGLVIISGGVSAQRSDAAAQALLRTATDKEIVDGDVKGAITQYQAIVNRYGTTDRATAAQALLRRPRRTGSWATRSEADLPADRHAVRRPDGGGDGRAFTARAFRSAQRHELGHPSGVERRGRRPSRARLARRQVPVGWRTVEADESHHPRPDQRPDDHADDRRQRRRVRRALDLLARRHEARVRVVQQPAALRAACHRPNRRTTARVSSNCRLAGWMQAFDWSPDGRLIAVQINSEEVQKLRARVGGRWIRARVEVVRAARALQPELLARRPVHCVRPPAQ